MVDFCSFNIRGLHNKIAFASDFVINNQLTLFAVLETHVKEGDALFLSKKVNPRFQWVFNYQHHHNGRIWLGWHPDFWSIQELGSSAQHISCSVTRKVDNVSFILSVVYAFNDTYARRSLWADLITFNDILVDNGTGKAWCVLGDFNTYLSSRESSGPPPRDFRSISEFRDCVNHLGITDLKFTGDIFTWRDCSSVSPLSRKLDRVMVNDYWLQYFDSSTANFLPRGLSDHNPSAVSLGLSRPRLHKPFQVFQHLIDHPEFLDVVKAAWDNNILGSPWFILTSKLRLVKSGLKRLNILHGDLNDRVRIARDELLSFQQNMPLNSNTAQRLHEMLLMDNYQQALSHQEILLKQKSRIKWLNYGDGNNRYFFNSCKDRWNSNKILSLEHNGVVYDQHRDISEVAVDFYKGIMGSVKPVSPFPNDLRVPALSSLECDLMVRPFSSSEVFNTITHMAKHRCPGPDGLTVEFFISSWEVIGADVSKAVLCFFENNTLPRIVNSAALTLIPKTSNASSLTHYRPISCCNVLYKVITKMLTTRMKHVMPGLVSSNQTAFVEGLFVLAMEALTACINRKTHSPDFKFHSRTKGAGISHLIFADDVLLFCHGDNDSIRCLLEAVDEFASISGLSPNPSKSMVFFGNVPSAVQDFTIALSKFNRGTLPVNYLGLPLISGKLFTRDCQPLTSRLCSKFEAWTCRFISQAGRAQLIQSVVFGIQNNWSMYMFLPKSVIKRIQSQMARFLWSGKIVGPCFFKVAWEVCCLRKCEGGLGFKELLSWNASAILFQVCRIINSNSNSDSLWLKWVHTAFLKDKAFWSMNVPAKCSWGLRKILNARPIAIQHVTYEVGLASNFLLWHDPWAGPRSLLDTLGLRAVSSLESNLMAKICSIIQNGSWFCGTSNDLTIIRLREICANIIIHNHDRILWDGTPSNSIKIGVIWDGIRRSGAFPSWHNFVWNKFRVPKFSFTTWLAVQERLLTKDRMVRFRMNIDNCCALCGTDNESHAHLFIHCNYVRQIFSAWDVNISRSWSDFQAGRINSDPLVSPQAREITYLFVSAVLFKVWEERNWRMHNVDRFKTATSLTIIIKQLVRDRLASSALFEYYISRDRSLISLIY